jgi:hypothetical protein
VLYQSACRVDVAAKMHVQDLDAEEPWIDMQTQSIKPRADNNDELYPTVPEISKDWEAFGSSYHLSGNER